MHDENRLPPITLSPDGPYRCGDSVTATWSLRNWGNSTTTGLRLKFVLPTGVSVIYERSRIPGISGEDLPKAFVPRPDGGEGVLIRDLAPGDGITAVIGLKVGRVHLGQDLWIQAVTDTKSGDRLMSQKTEIPVRLSARLSVPQPTPYTIKSDSQNFGMKIVVVNDGGVPDKDVLIEIPIPSVVEVGEPALPEEASVDFDRENAIMRIKLGNVPAYQKQEIGLQFRANEYLVGDRLEIIDIVVTSPSSGSFNLEPVPVQMDAHVDFSNSAIIVEPGPYVKSGSQVMVTVHVHNHGRSAAKDIVTSVELPECLIYAPGSLALNGAHDARKDDLSNVIIPVIRARTTTTLSFYATVRSPITNQARFLVKAKVDGIDITPLEIASESSPDFPAEENYLFMEGPQTVEPHAEREVMIKVTNAGTETSRGVRIRVDAPEISINRAVVAIDGGHKSVAIIPIFRGNSPSSAIDLGEIGPQEERIVKLSVTAPETFVHGTEFPLHCYIRHDSGTEEILGEMVFTGRSFPRISQTESIVKSQRMGPLRVGQPRNISVLLRNSGSDVARNVRVFLDLPSSLRIEGVFGAKQENNILVFNEIPAQSSSEATITLRMTGTGTGDGTIEIHPVVSGERMNTIDLEPLVLTTASQSFIDDVRIETINIENDSSLMVRMTFKNIGDGEANNIIVSSEPVEGYAINTTTFDGKKIRDIMGKSPLSYGLSLTPIQPGTETEITFIVNLGDKTYIPTFKIESDDQDEMTVKGKPYQAPLKDVFMPQYLTNDSQKSARALTGTIDSGYQNPNKINIENKTAEEEIILKKEAIKEVSPSQDVFIMPPAYVENPTNNDDHVKIEEKQNNHDDSSHDFNIFNQSKSESDNIEEKNIYFRKEDFLEKNENNETVIKQEIEDVKTKEQPVEETSSLVPAEYLNENHIEKPHDLQSEKANEDLNKSDAIVIVSDAATITEELLPVNHPESENNQSENKTFEDKVEEIKNISQEHTQEVSTDLTPTKSLEEVHAEEVHVEEVHAEEVHAEEAHVEEAHAEEKHAEEKHVEEAHAEETIKNQEYDSIKSKPKNNWEDEIIFRPESRFRPKIKSEFPTEDSSTIIGNRSSRLRVGSIERVTAPVIIAKYDKARIDQIRSTVEILFKKEEIGWYRHILATRLFVADRIVGTDPKVENAWMEILTTTKRDIKVPLMRLVMPNWSPDMTWVNSIGSNESLAATEVLMSEIPGIIRSGSIIPAPKINDDEIASSLQLGNFGFFDANEEMSTAFFDTLLPEMMPIGGSKWEKFGESLQKYRDALSKIFKTNAYKSEILRYEQMIRSQNDELDKALKDIIIAIESEMI